MKQDTLFWLLDLKELIDASTFCRVQERISAIPDSLQLLHGDPNPGNFMFSDGKLMLIDWDTFCCGDSIFELATLYACYKQLPGINVLAAKMFGLTIQKAARMWQRILELYMGKCSEQELIETEQLAKLLGCIRIIHYMKNHPELPDQKQAIGICKDEILRCK